MSNDKIIIFTDGASKGNPGPGGWGAIVIHPEVLSKGLFESQVTELGGGEKHTTNNRMELMGAIKALAEIRQHTTFADKEVTVYTDSKYLIGGMTEWMKNWVKNNWKKGKISSNGKTKGEDVLNRDLWEQLAILALAKQISWHYVAGHTGHSGNERCDEIASGFALGEKVDLYNGSLAKYPVKVVSQL